MKEVIYSGKAGFVRIIHDTCPHSCGFTWKSFPEGLERLYPLLLVL